MEHEPLETPPVPETPIETDPPTEEPSPPRRRPGGRLRRIFAVSRLREALSRLPALQALLPRAGSRRTLRWILPVVLALGLGAVLGVTVAAAIHMPRVDTLADFSPARITQLLDRDGQVFASYARQRRIVLAQEQIPDLMREAVIAVEDSKFYQHGGLDAIGVVRAAISNFRSGTRTEGASTLTMQLARKLFLTPEKKWRRKIEEALLAVELEKTYSKQQLLTLYLNVMYLGHGQYGVEAAARYFFGKSVSELDLAQTATLAGIYQRPSVFSPYKTPDAVVERRNHVLNRMLAEGFITDEEHEAAVAAPLEVVTHHPKTELGPYFAEEIRRHLETDYGSNTLLEGGLQVETTLDARIEASAEKALRQGLLSLDHSKGWRGPVETMEGELEELELASWIGTGVVPGRWYQGLVLESNRNRALVKIEGEIFPLTPEGVSWTRRRSPSSLLKRGDVAWFRLEEDPEAEDGAPTLQLEQEPEVQGAALVLESATGAVRAMVGGWDFSRNQFNRTTQARRQAGSAFKIFVYGAALETGLTPADTLFDAPVYFMGAENRLTYSPTNYYSDDYYGIVTLARALEKSMNVTAVKVLDLVGVDRIIDFARRAGVQSELPPYPSLALGSADLAPLELAAAYAAIANQGTYVEPYMIERVRTPEGLVLEERVTKTQTVTSPEIAFVLTRMLEGVVDRGTGVRVRDLDLAIAGKTGTTNDYSNAWFAGFTPRYTLLVWVGYDRLRSLGRGMAGDKVALPIWRDMVVDGLETGWLEPGGSFPPPPGVNLTTVEHLTGLRATPEAPVPVEMAFLAGTEPVREYTPEWGRIMALPWYQQRPFYIPKESERMPEDFIGIEEELAAEEAAKAAGGG